MVITSLSHNTQTNQILLLKSPKKKINFFFQIYYTLSILPYQSTSRRKGVIEFVSGIKISETNLSLFYAIEAGFIFIM